MITIADYIGHCDKNGEPIGHPIKVINENYTLIEGLTDICIAVPQTHQKEIKCPKADIKVLPHSVCAFSTDRINDLIKKWKNLHKLMNSCSKSAENSTIWFINVDFSLFLFLYLFGKKKNRIWITLCYNPLKGIAGWRRNVVTSVLKRAELLIVTNKNFMEDIPGNKIFIPDYYYYPDLYERFKHIPKKDQMVCLGTMGHTKKLEELVAAVNNSPIPLFVVGNFRQEERVQQLKAMAGPNVCIQDHYVGNNEFYTWIAESKYVVLPYDMDLYDERTSGILIESVFLGSVPVAPKKLLEYNGIHGVGYKDIQEIPMLIDTDINRILEENNILVDTVFSKTTIQNKLGDCMNIPV